MEEQIGGKIKEACLVKFGNLYIYKKDLKVPKLEHCYSVRPWEGIPKKDRPPPIEIEELVSCLEESSQVDNVCLNERKQQVKWRALLFDPHIRWHFRPILRFELNIPFRNQEFASRMKERLGDKMEASTDFTVFYDASNYIITSKVQDTNKHHCVTSARDFLLSLLEKKFRVEKIPPNPMREDYYLLFLSDIDKIEKPKRIVKGARARAFLMPLKDEARKRKNELLSRLLLSSWEFLDIFYSGSMIASNLRNKYVELNKLHMDIQKRSKEFFTTPSRSLFKRRKIKKDIDELIPKHYEIILDTGICINLIQDAKLVVAEEGKGLVPFFKTADKLIKENYGYYPLNVNSFNLCLEYTKEMMERTFSWRLALYAAVFGTISSLLVKYGVEIIDFLNTLFP